MCVQAMLAVPGILSVEALGKGPWWSAPFTVRPTLFPGPYRCAALTNKVRQRMAILLAKVAHLTETVLQRCVLTGSLEKGS